VRNTDREKAVIRNKWWKDEACSRKDHFGCMHWNICMRIVMRFVERRGTVCMCDIS